MANVHHDGNQNQNQKLKNKTKKLGEGVVKSHRVSGNFRHDKGARWVVPGFATGY